VGQLRAFTSSLAGCTVPLIVFGRLGPKLILVSQLVQGTADIRMPNRERQTAAPCRLLT